MRETASCAERGVRAVVFVVDHGMALLDFACAVTVFRCANDVVTAEAYRLATLSSGGDAVTSFEGVRVAADGALEAWSAEGAPIDTLVVPGWGSPPRKDPSRSFLDALAALARRARRVVGICTGTFTLAAAGLLRGRAVTTHWGATRLLARRYPDLRLDVAALFVRDGNVWTSAGVTAGLDLALQLVEDDFDADVARKVAAWLVHVRRGGTQLQKSPAMLGERSRRAAIRKLSAWIRGHLSSDLSLDRLAERAGMSRRTLTRAFASELGCTVAELVERVRVDEAARLLEVTDRSVKRIAADVGMRSSQQLASAFRRQRGTTPSAFRASRYGQSRRDRGV